MWNKITIYKEIHQFSIDFAIQQYNLNPKGGNYYAS